ncbi:MAG: glutathione S-transferase family protein [Kofleriaceae bacterium]
MTSLQLIGTPLSHFSRKLRILLAELGVPFTFVRPPGVLTHTPATYGGNPLMRVPTLIDGDVTLFESEHIARYLVRRHDPADRFGVGSERVDDLNRLALINGVMANEVVVLLSRRAGLEATDSVAYFRKLLAAIDLALAELDRGVEVDAPSFDYRDVALVCMWQHLVHYQLRADLARYRRIAARVTRFADRPSVASTTPEASLAEAAAAGWQPG